jgi:phosphatidylserine decarboxylase
MPSTKPVKLPDDPCRLVSCVDCRLMVFGSVNEARLWINGQEFIVGLLLGDVGDAFDGQADRYLSGAVAIFRFAPQDYRHFHSPVDGKIGPMTYIPGEYYIMNVSPATLVFVYPSSH